MVRQLVRSFCREISSPEVLAQNPRVSLTQLGANDRRERTLEITDAPWSSNSPFGNLAVRLAVSRAAMSAFRQSPEVDVHQGSYTRQMRPEFRRQATLYARPKAKGGVAMRMMLKIMIPRRGGQAESRGSVFRGERWRADGDDFLDMRDSRKFPPSSNLCSWESMRKSSFSPS